MPLELDLLLLFLLWAAFVLGLVENVGHKRLLSLRWRFILNSFCKLKALLFSLESPSLENMKVRKTEIQVGAGRVELNGLEQSVIPNWGER